VVLLVLGLPRSMRRCARAALVELPRQARRWRLQQKERAMYTALLDAFTQLLGGRTCAPAGRARSLEQTTH
jgi:HemY protein